MHGGSRRVKPLHLNLATNPYRDYRPVYAVVVVTSLVIAFLMLNNIETYYRYVSETRNTRSKTAQLESEAAKQQRLAQAIDEKLRTINAAALDRQTRFINAQLAERAFSWSELLDRLERVTPNDVRITSIQPSFSPTGLVHLEISCEAKTTNGMVETIIRFNSARQFSNPFPHHEQQQEHGGYQFGLGVDYRPSIARVVLK
jgi:Tfp pilus assembly protein PilN